MRGSVGRRCTSTSLTWPRSCMRATSATVAEHLARLVELRDATTDPARRLHVVASAYAEVCLHRAQHGTLELSALTHAPERVAGAEEQLLELFEQLPVSYTHLRAHETDS